MTLTELFQHWANQPQMCSCPIGHTDNRGLTLPDQSVCERELAWRRYCSKRDGTDYSVTRERYQERLTAMLTLQTPERIKKTTYLHKTEGMTQTQAVSL